MTPNSLEATRLERPFTRWHGDVRDLDSGVSPSQPRKRKAEVPTTRVVACCNDVARKQLSKRQLVNSSSLLASSFGLLNSQFHPVFFLSLSFYFRKIEKQTRGVFIYKELHILFVRIYFYYICVRVLDWNKSS